MEFEHGGQIYRADKIPVMEQFHIMRKILPLFASVGGVEKQIDKPADGDAKQEEVVLSKEEFQARERQFSGFAEGLAAMDRKDADFVLMSLLGCVFKKMDSGLGWAAVAKGGHLMYQDIDISSMLKLAWEALKENFSAFTGALPSILKGAK